MEFTNFLWTSAVDVYKEILNHPFLQGVITGNLDENAFHFYIIQDIRYLQVFSSGLIHLGRKAPKYEWRFMFSEHAVDMLEMKDSFSGLLISELGYEFEEVYQIPMAPENLLYISFLLNAAQGQSFYEALAAFLPCYWFYAKLGVELKKQGSPMYLYQQWIRSLNSPRFMSKVKNVLSIMNQVVENLSEEEKELVRRHFVTAAEFEYRFWDMAYSRRN